MNGPAENTAHDAPENEGRTERFLDLGTARRMLPLVRRIVADILHQQRRLAELRPEQEHLFRRRRILTWPERSRRYQLQEEINAMESGLGQAHAELEELGVTLIDPEFGAIGFPTLVNEHRAFFSWRPGEDTLNYWHFAGETLRRMIPSSWVKASDVRLLSKR